MPICMDSDLNLKAFHNSPNNIYPSFPRKGILGLTSDEVLGSLTYKTAN